MELIIAKQVSKAVWHNANRIMFKHVPSNAITYLYNTYIGHAYYNIMLYEHDYYKIQGW